MIYNPPLANGAARPPSINGGKPEPPDPQKVLTGERLMHPSATPAMAEEKGKIAMAGMTEPYVCFLLTFITRIATHRMSICF